MNNTYKEFSDKVKMFSILLESKEFSNQKCYDLTHIETKSTPESRTVMASRLANTDEVKAFRKYLNSKQLINPIGLVNNKDEDSLQSDEAIIEINSDNILELLQAEYSRVKDADKRTMLLLRIADFQKLQPKKTEVTDKPKIYLPQRCNSCEYKIKYEQRSD